MSNTEQALRQNKQFTLTSWIAQGTWNPVVADRGEGVYVWDTEGKRYLDWSSQLVNANIGHSHPKVVKAIADQAARLCYVDPGWATGPRGQLGEALHAVLPRPMQKTMFTVGGADAIENAIKIARLYTGRKKILTRSRAYHGATFGAMTAGGDPRRLANEPGIPGVVRLPDPYAYRSAAYRGRTREEGDAIIADMIEDTIKLEGPEHCAALITEGYSGSSGVIQPTKVWFERVHEICRKYGILLIVDEVMSGFGRTGEWFGISHYPAVTPDIMVMAKGLTSGYVPLGAVAVSEPIAKHFDDHVLWGGLTYSAHALSCAAAVATLQVYHDERLVERARALGPVLRAGLDALAERHPVVGEVRGAGLHHVMELVKSRSTREPMSPFNGALSEPMRVVAKTLKDNGLSTIVRWNYVFSTPPLVITEAQIREGLEVLDLALTKLDAYYEG